MENPHKCHLKVCAQIICHTEPGTTSPGTTPPAPLHQVPLHQAPLHQHHSTSTTPPGTGRWRHKVARGKGGGGVTWDRCLVCELWSSVHYWSPLCVVIPTLTLPHMYRPHPHTIPITHLMYIHYICVSYKIQTIHLFCSVIYRCHFVPRTCVFQRQQNVLN